MTTEKEESQFRQQGDSSWNILRPGFKINNTSPWEPPPQIGAPEINKPLPWDNISSLEDLALDLATKASGLASQIPLALHGSIGGLVRTMNCYYAYLLEGQDIPPSDIDSIRVNDPLGYSEDPQKREMQRAAGAYIKVGYAIDHRQDKHSDNVVGVGYLKWLHSEYCRHVPTFFSELVNQSTGESSWTPPGQMRIDSLSGDWLYYDDWVRRAYGKTGLSRLKQIETLGALYHRLLWVRPFPTCNRQVALLQSYATLQECGVASSLWSVERGVVTNWREINNQLFAANFQEELRSFSVSGLTKFCEFFLKICIEQIDFMASLFKPKTLLYRMRQHIDEEVRVGNLRKGSFQILRESLLTGEVPRGNTGEITGEGERTARKVVSELLNKGYLKSGSPHGPLILDFPINTVEQWLPGLYPYFATRH